MSFVGPGDVVTYLVWLEQVQKLGLGDESTPGDRERRMHEESGEFNLKVYKDGSFIKCNRDADFLNSQEGSFYQNASNLNSGTIPRARHGALWRDNTSNQTSSPFIQTGENTIPTGSGSHTIYFDEAFTQVPRVTFSTDKPSFGARQSVSTTAFQVQKNATFSFTINWNATGRKD